MPNLPIGTMVVYTSWLYLGLVGCAVIGFSLGLLAAFVFFDRRCVSCVARDYECDYLGED